MSKSNEENYDQRKRRAEFDARLIEIMFDSISTIKENAKLRMELHEPQTIITHNHHVTKIVAVVKICIANDLITKTTELITLALASAQHGEYFIAKRMMQCSFRLCSVVISTNLVKRLKSLSTLWWRAQCSYCGNTCADTRCSTKHKACSGCMKLVYCSRGCQKKHWNCQHRRRCDQSWLSIYKALKIIILDRV